MEKTPLQKAEELVLKFVPYVYCYMGSGMLSNDYDKKVVLDNAKACAIISANATLESLREIAYNVKDQIAYWDQVKSSLGSLIELVEI